MHIRVVKSSEATVKIPHVCTIEPGTASNGYITNIEGILNEMKRAYEEYQAIPHDPAQNRNTNIRRSNLLHLSVINNKEVSLQFLSNLREASTPEQAKTIEKFIAEIQDSDRNDLNSLAEFINLYLADGWIKPPNRLEDVVKLFNSLQFQAVIKAVLETTPEEAEQNRQERVANFEFMPEVQELLESKLEKKEIKQIKTENN